MGNQFGRAHRWSSNFKTSVPAGEPRFEDLGYSWRETTTDRGFTVQELTAFDPATNSLAAEDPTTTQLTMKFVMEPKSALPPEEEAKVHMGLTPAVKLLAEELKYYVEEGQRLSVPQQ